MSGTLAALAQALSDGAVRVVDLTATLSPDTVVIDLPPIFAASPGLSMDLISQYDDNGPAWYWNTITLGEHTGTHFDAPVHWVTGKDLPDNATDTLPPGRFVGPACVVDVTKEAAEDNDFLLTPEFLLAWEEKHGRIPAGAWLLMRSGWSKRTGKAEFLNIDENGSHTPGPSPDCVRFLAEERDVLGFGTECVGTDAGNAGGFDPPFPCHNIMHGNGKLGLASLTNLDQLPPTGAIVIAAPLKLKNGSGSPVRVIGLVEG